MVWLQKNVPGDWLPVLVPGSGFVWVGLVDTRGPVAAGPRRRGRPIDFRIPPERAEGPSSVRIRPLEGPARMSASVSGFANAQQTDGGQAAQLAVADRTGRFMSNPRSWAGSRRPSGYSGKQEA